MIGAYEGFRPFVLDWLRLDRTTWPLPHFYLQRHFLEHEGDLAVDFVGRVETIEEDFTAVYQHLDRDADLPTMNATPGGGPPLTAYYDSDAVIQRVQEVYWSDFDRLGYSRDVRCAEGAGEK